MLATKLSSIQPRLFASVEHGRYLSLLSWGRNVEGQCGVETGALVSQPTPVLELEGLIHTLSAGRHDSGVITSCGEAWTWGCGKAGKLGHGSSETVPLPARVESLAGRVGVQSMALGEQHTLFVDKRGGVWSCGDNQQGQCGLRGTTHNSDISERWAQGSSRASLLLANHAGAQHLALASKALVTLFRHAYNERADSSLLPQAELAASRQQSPVLAVAPQQWEGHAGGTRGWDVDGPHAVGPRLAAVATACLRAAVEPGHQHVPVRVGQSQEPMSLWSPTQAQQALKMWEGASGLEHEQVVATATSRRFSVVITARGEVWTFGQACGAAPSSRGPRWTFAAQRLSGRLAEEISDLGGAVSVAAGDSFAVVLTRSGQAVVWGRLPGGEKTQNLRLVDNMLIMTSESGPRMDSGVVIPGLTGLTHVAATDHMVVMSDGEAVWMVGRGIPSARLPASQRWDSPREVLRLSGEHLVQLAAGPTSCAAVTSTGNLYLWGRLLDRQSGEAVLKAARGGRAHALSKEVDWSWAGFGSLTPTRVPGLGFVKQVALGAEHALALVE